MNPTDELDLFIRFKDIALARNTSEFFPMKPTAKLTPNPVSTGSNKKFLSANKSARMDKDRWLFFIRWSSSIRWNLFVGLFLFIVFSTASAQTQDPCRATLERAEDQYDVGEYDEVIALLEQCPPEKFLEPRQQIRAYKLAALAQLKIGAEKPAEAAVESLLDLRPQFKPDPEQDPQAFVDLVNEIKRRRASSSRKKWLFIGGGGLTAGAVAAYFIFKEKGLEDLPLPPDPPR
jgi:hypothetical protein